MALSVTKPVVNGSSGTWGTILNQAIDDIVSAVNTGQTTNATTDTNVTNLTTRVTTAENNITALQAGSGFYSGTTATRTSDTHYAAGGHFYDTTLKMHFVGSTNGWVPMPGTLLFKGRCTTAPAYADGATVGVPWDTEDYDALGVFTPGAGATSYVPGIVGWYEISGNVSFTASATGTRFARWQVAGAIPAGGGVAGAPAPSGVTVLAAPTVTVKLTATSDTIALTATSSGAATSGANASGFHYPTMTVKYLGPG